VSIPWDIIPSKFLKNNGLTRRLTLVADKEGKTRIVAIFDYWSQIILFPIHKVLADLLKGIKEDCTFNQDNFRNLICEESPHVWYYSIDLKAATDRFPVSLQRMILVAIFGSTRFADA